VESFPDDPFGEQNTALKRSEKGITLQGLMVKRAITPLMWRNYLIIGQWKGRYCAA